MSGEHDYRINNGDQSLGSSPRERGALADVIRAYGVKGIIPA